MKKRAGHRKHHTGFTLIELLVVIAIIAILMAILMPALSRARKQGKRAVCLSNCKQLVLGWVSYAETYEGKIVNGGDTQYPAPTTNPSAYAKVSRFWNSGFPTTEIPNYSWAWNTMNAQGGPVLTYEQRIKKMKEGALYPFCKDIALFRCSEARKEFHETYSIVTSMNARWKEMALCCGSREGPINYNLGQIVKPSEKIVFVEEGNPSPNGYEVYYSREGWCDAPQAPHTKASDFAFADGHAELWKWVDKRTMCWVGGEKGDWSDPLKTYPECDGDQPGNKDLQRIQIATYGKLGYPPSPTPPGNNLN
jgi:prepilin-type N-terminal cleavage/methylation domain-containing protein/prepilin-type processing-associated H-X9-DG protein